MVPLTMQRLPGTRSPGRSAPVKTLAALPLLALLAAAAWRAGAPAAIAPSRAQPAAGATLRVYVDPATGLRREPTADELAAEAAHANAPAATGVVPAARSSVALAASADEIRLPDGTVGVRVPRRALHVVQLCRQPDGRYGEHCEGHGVAP